MFGWIFTIVFCAVLGVVVGLVDTWVRGEAFPSWRILGVAAGASVVGGVISKVATGRLIPHLPVIGMFVALMIDRANERTRRHL